MARKPTPKPLTAAKLTPEQMRKGIDRLNLRIADLEAFDVSCVSTGHENSIRALETAIDETLARVFGEGTSDYARYKGAANLQKYELGIFMVGPGVAQPVTPVSEIQAEVAGRKANALALLRRAVQGLEEDLRDAVLPAQAPALPKPTSRKVFVVHGHDEAALQAVSRFLERLGLEAVVLREQPDQGRTIIEKFEACVGEVGFAVVLLTPDDVGGTVAAAQHSSRARQNVVFELGYFAGKLGRGKTCLLRKGDVEIPSDLYGVIYTELDAYEGWKSKLAKELRTAGFDVDFNKVLM